MYEKGVDLQYAMLCGSFPEKILGRGTNSIFGVCLCPVSLLHPLLPGFLKPRSQQASLKSSCCAAQRVKPTRATTQRGFLGYQRSNMGGSHVSFGCVG